MLVRLKVVVSVTNDAFWSQLEQVTLANVKMLLSIGRLTYADRLSKEDWRKLRIEISECL